MENDLSPARDIARTITIRLDRVNGESQLVIRVQGTTSTLKSRLIPDKQIEWSRARLKDYLERIYEASPRTEREGLFTGDMAKLGRALKDLYVFSSNLLADLFGAHGIAILTKYLAWIWEARIGDLLQRELPVGTIEYESSLDRFLPLDYLFLQFWRFNTEPRDLTQFVQALSNVLGFAFLIRRRFPRSIDTYYHAPTSVGARHTTVAYDSRLTTDILAHTPFVHAAREIDFFREKNQHAFSLVGDPTRSYQSAEEIVQELMAHPEVQLHHLLCHARTDDDDGWRHELMIGGPRVAIAELRAAFEERMAEGPDAPAPAERLAFVNACESAGVNPFSRASLLELFTTYTRHSGVVGAEYTVPDHFAYEFARVFYAYLFKFRDPAMALFKARWFFAKKYRNMLGTFYTFYANADIRLGGPPRLLNL